ncbi:MAG: hypothetical protein M3Q30_24975 [Actinomycetota bacterium]|nr:hypothetical protein [Actinomycetota bacterium]
MLLDLLERRFPTALASDGHPDADDDGVEYLAVGPTERRLAENLARFKRTLPLRLDPTSDTDEWCGPPPVAEVAVPEWPDDDDDVLLVPWSTLDAALDPEQEFLVAEFLTGK